MLPDLLHGEERKVWVMAAIKARPSYSRSRAEGAGYDCRRTKYKTMWRGSQAQEHHQGRVRAKVEHPFAFSNVSSDLPRCAIGHLEITSGCARLRAGKSVPTPQPLTRKG